MRVLVTGHQGYLGSVMVPVLRAAGHHVVGLDCGLVAECVTGPRPPDPPAIDVDIRDVTLAQLAGFDAVIHLAALAEDSLGVLAPRHTYDVNHRAALRLGRLAKQAGVRRFLYASSCSVYGSAGDTLVTETAPRRPLTPYAESKVRAEDGLAALADTAFAPVFLRCATAFGSSPRMRTDTLLNHLVGHALLCGTVRVLGDGSAWRPSVHARDVAEAFVLALAAPTDVIHNAVFNVGTETNNHTVAEIARTVADAVPGTELVISGEPDPDARSYRLDCSAIRNVLGYRAVRTVADGAAELFDSYLAAGLTRRDLAHRWSRLAYLEASLVAGRVDAGLRTVRSGVSAGPTR